MGRITQWIVFLLVLGAIGSAFSDNKTTPTQAAVPSCESLADFRSAVRSNMRDGQTEQRAEASEMANIIYYHRTMCDDLGNHTGSAMSDN